MPFNKRTIEHARAEIQKLGGRAAHTDKFSEIKEGDVVAFGESWCYVECIKFHESKKGQQNNVGIFGYDIRTRKECRGVFDPATYDRVGKFFSSEMLQGHLSGIQGFSEFRPNPPQVKTYRITDIHRDKEDKYQDRMQLEDIEDRNHLINMVIPGDRLGRYIRYGLPWGGTRQLVVTCSMVANTNIVTSVHSLEDDDEVEEDDEEEDEEEESGDDQ